MSLPNFLCVGTPRGGTTWLHECLAGHPQVYVPDCKDINFFRRWRNEPSLLDRYGISPYRDLFAKGAANSVRLDVSAGLFAGAGTAECLHAHLPEASLIVIL